MGRSETKKRVELEVALWQSAEWYAEAIHCKSGGFIGGCPGLAMMDNPNVASGLSRVAGRLLETARRAGQGRGVD
jgi:hypothetical protein